MVWFRRICMFSFTSIIHHDDMVPREIKISSMGQSSSLWLKTSATPLSTDPMTPYSVPNSHSKPLLSSAQRYLFIYRILFFLTILRKIEYGLDMENVPDETCRKESARSGLLPTFSRAEYAKIYLGFLNIINEI